MSCQGVQYTKLKWALYMEVKKILLIVSLTVVGLIIAYLRRRFSPETLVNGHMDLEKAKELSPETFEKKSEKKPK